jgi:hypothetical protein
MMTTAATSQPRLTDAEAWREVADRQISLTPAIGKLWMASVDLKGDGHNRKRAIRSISATGSTPIAAIAALIEKLDAGETPQLDHDIFHSEICAK